MSTYPNDQGLPLGAVPVYLVEGGVAVSNSNPLSTTPGGTPVGFATVAINQLPTSQIPALNTDGGLPVHVVNGGAGGGFATVAINQLPTSQIPALNTDGGLPSHVTNPVVLNTASFTSVTTSQIQQLLTNSIPAGTNTIGSVHNPDIVSSASAAAVTPSDSVNLTGTTRGVYVGGTGNVTAVINSTAITFTAVPVGTILPIAATRINATGTTATNMVALF